MRTIEKTIPPYAGNQPYLYFCFSDEDQNRVRPLLERLFRRGVRIWYKTGDAGNAEKQRSDEARMRGASLVLLYLSDAFRYDVGVKSHAMACCLHKQPLLCLNTDNGDSGLSIGLPSDLPTLPFKKATPEEMENAILRADGFSQDLLGPPQKPGSNWVRTLAVTVAVVAALLLCSALLYAFLRPHDGSAPQPEDTVFFSDPALTAAVRRIVDGPITEESLNGVTSLSFDALPEDISGLSCLPNLTRIELPQNAVLDAPEQVLTLTDSYEIVLIGGDAP